MKLLFGQNLSHRLVASLQDLFEGSQHVRNLGLNEALDTKIWNFARENGFVIVSKDADFQQRSLLLGFPPKIIWLRLGNCSTAQAERILRGHRDDIEVFERDATATFLILS